MSHAISKSAVSFPEIKRWQNDCNIVCITGENVQNLNPCHDRQRIKEGKGVRLAGRPLPVARVRRGVKIMHFKAG